MTGMRLWIGAISSLGSVVIMEYTGKRDGALAKVAEDAASAGQAEVVKKGLGGRLFLLDRPDSGQGGRRQKMAMIRLAG
jgi:hypothetical protein